MLISCSSDNDSSSKTSSGEFTQKSSTFDLSSDPIFVQFVQDFINNYVEYSYYQQIELGSNQPAFEGQIANPSLSLTQVEQVYSNNGADFEIILDYQTMANDLVYQVYTYYPEFENMSETDASMLIIAEMGEVIDSGLVTIDNPYGPTTITADELWYCVVESVGLGFVSAIGMKQLKKQGVKVITKTLTKFLSRFAGPIGVGIAVADFGFCLYRADNNN